MNEQGWIDWHGGECPVNPDTRVEVKLQAYTDCFNASADDFRWDHNFGDPHNIIAYRIVEPGK